jgi:hypothetical protein
MPNTLNWYKSTYDGRRMPPEVRPDVRVRFPFFGANCPINTCRYSENRQHKQQQQQQEKQQAIVVNCSGHC